MGLHFGVRHLQCLLLFLALAVTFMMRVNLSVAIVAMMDSNSANPDFEEYAWSEQTKSLLLSSFLWGYCITQIPGGQLAHRFGGKIMLLCSLFLNGILTMLTPLSVRIGDWPLLLAMRLLQGLMQGCIFPSVHTILSKWIPPEERGAWGTFCYTGVQFGTVVMMGVSGVVAASSLGWPGIFYISGALTLLWSAVWYVVGASTPNDFKWISLDEKSLIAEAVSTNSESQLQSMKTPWLQICTSPPFLALLMSQCACAWGFWTLLTQIPSYLKSILDKDIQSNALFSALPFLACLTFTYIFCLVDTLLGHFSVSIYVRRKSFNTVGLWGPVAPLIALGYIDSDQSTLAIVLLVLAVGLTAGQFLGFLVNHIDLSPNFAGVLMGIANCVAHIMGLMAPLFVGFIVTDPENVSEWRIIFYITATYFVIGNALFLIFGETTPQSWNFPREKE